MHFTNAIVSVFALASFANATLSPRQFNEPLEELAARQYEESRMDYLEARDEFMEKRELFRRLGGPAFCTGDTKPYPCMEKVPGPADWATKWRKCGMCGKKDKMGAKCSC